MSPPFPFSVLVPGRFAAVSDIFPHPTSLHAVTFHSLTFLVPFAFLVVLVFVPGSSVVSFSTPGSLAVIVLTLPGVVSPIIPCSLSLPRPRSLPPGRVALVFNAVKSILQRGDEDAASVVVSHFGLLDQRDGGDQGLDGRPVLVTRSILNRPVDSR